MSDPLRDQILDYLAERDPQDLLKDIFESAKRDWARYRDPTAFLTYLTVIALHKRYSGDPIAPAAFEFAREMIEDLRRNPERTDLDIDRDIRRWQRDVRWILRKNGFKLGDRIPGAIMNDMVRIARRGRKAIEAYISSLKKDSTPKA